MIGASPLANDRHPASGIVGSEGCHWLGCVAPPKTFAAAVQYSGDFLLQAPRIVTKYTKLERSYSSHNFAPVQRGGSLLYCI